MGHFEVEVGFGDQIRNSGGVGGPNHKVSRILLSC